MNKNHRVVWSAHRQAFVVAHEAASSRAPGPSSSTVGAVAKAVAALTLSAVSHQALAIPGCAAAVSGVITISSATSYSCSLSGGNSVLVTSDGSLEGIFLGGASTGSRIQNAGTVLGSYDPGIFLEIGSMESITNTGTILATATSSGTLTAGILVDDTTVQNGISNTGAILGGHSGVDHGYGVAITNGSLVGGLVNAGTIAGTGGIMGYGVDIEGSTITGSISNSGTISGSAVGLRAADSSISGFISNYADGVIESLGQGIAVEGTAVIGGISNMGIIQGGEGALALSNNSAAFNVENTGTIDGEVYLGINTLNLNGPSGRVMGDTYGYGSSTVNVNGMFTSEGRFRVGNFNVASTGVFHQAHDVTVSGGMATNHGVWDVGTGSQTITGNFEQSSGGTLRVGLSDASTYGSLQVRGEAALADGSSVFVNVIGAPTLVIDSTITGVLTAEDGLTANASALDVKDNSALYKFSAAATSDPGHALDLIVEKDSVGLPAAVRSAGYVSAEGAAQALQTMFNDGIPAGMQDIFDRLNNMTDAQAAAAVSQTLPSITGASAQAAVSALRSMNKVIQSRIESLQGLSSGDGGADRYAWVRAFGNWSDQNNRRGVAGFKSDTGGLVIGADAPLSDRLRAGGAFTYAKSSIKSKSTTAASQVDVDTFEVVGYASYNLDPHTDINYQLDVGTNKASSSREVSFMGTRAKADFDSVVVHGSVGIGRLMPISPATSWTPSVRVDYTYMRTEGYTEDGAGALNLDVDAQTYRELLLTGDAKVSHQFEGGLKLLANASLGYDFINKQAKSTSTFTGGGPAFVTDGLDVSPWFYRLGAGLAKETGQGVEYSVRYDMEGRTSGYLNQSVSAKVRWAF